MERFPEVFKVDQDLAFNSISVPDETFHNFIASKSVDWRILWSYEMSMDGFKSSKICESARRVPKSLNPEMSMDIFWGSRIVNILIGPIFLHFLVWRDTGVILKGRISRLPTMLALRLDCSTGALTAPQKVSPMWRLVELKMLDFSDRTRSGVSFLLKRKDFPRASKDRPLQSVCSSVHLGDKGSLVQIPALHWHRHFL